MANLSKNPTALTRVRRAAGLSRTQLAEKVGISDRTIERWEQRRSDIGEAAAGSVLAIATTLGCNVEDILDTLPTIDVSKKSSRQQIGTQKNLWILTSKNAALLQDYPSTGLQPYREFKGRRYFLMNQSVTT